MIRKVVFLLIVSVSLCYGCVTKGLMKHFSDGNVTIAMAFDFVRKDDFAGYQSLCEKPAEEARMQFELLKTIVRSNESPTEQKVNIKDGLYVSAVKFHKTTVLLTMRSSNEEKPWRIVKVDIASGDR